jgi:hypothetical protein
VARRSWRLKLALALIVSIALAGCTSGSSASNTTMDSSLTGPPLDTSSSAVASAVEFGVADVPSGWMSDRQAGSCIVGAGGNPSQPYCGNPPLPGSNQQATDDAYAHCLGLPVDRISMFTGNDEPGEPPTFASSTYSPPGSSTDQNGSGGPEAQMYVTVERSANDERADLAAVSRPSASGCTERWFRNGFILKFLGALTGDFKEGQLKTDITITPATVSTIPGVRATAFSAHVSFQLKGLMESFNEESVLLGSGRIEVILELGDIQAFPTGTAPRLIGVVERKMYVEASS